MRNDSIVLAKAKAFAVRAVNLQKYLEAKKEFTISNQLKRSATSIGANITEALCGISRKDFHAKMYIAYKEASESLYWIELLYKTEYLSEKEFNSIYNDCYEIKKILGAITYTGRVNN